MIVIITNTRNVRFEEMVDVARVTENEIATDIKKMEKVRKMESGEPRSIVSSSDSEIS